jgi:hypothetical protein
MAGTYGAAGLNPYTIKGIGGILSNEVNVESGATQVYRGGVLTTQQSIGTYNPATGKFTPDANANLTSAEKSTLSSTSGTTAIKNAAIQTAAKAGAKNASQLLSPNTAKTPNSPDAQSGSTPAPDASKPQTQTTSSGGTGAVFVYPIGMRSTQQDRLKFTAVEYQPSGNLSAGTFGSQNRTSTQGKNIVGSVFLPIQASISDFNSVEWQSANINEVEKQAVNMSLGAMNAGGVDDLTKKLGENLNTALKEVSGANKEIKVAFAGEAVGIGNLLGRFGTVLNPNLELLFSGPQLRPFEFKFQMSAREKDEGENIKAIINFFKKNMAVKKSDGAGIFLKAPNTFLIEYKYNGADTTHPGINLIKECALLSCSVEYTPLGTYMTYPDGTMVSYSMSLSFSELEPIYSTDYDGHPIGY